MRVAPDRSPLCRRGMVPVWSADAIGTQTTDAGAPNMPMQPTAAREIVGFLTVVGGALAAADEQAVGRVSVRNAASINNHVLWCFGKTTLSCHEGTNRAWDECPLCRVVPFKVVSTPRGANARCADCGSGQRCACCYVV